jgi:DNA mismatch repair protein MutL
MLATTIQKSLGRTSGPSPEGDAEEYDGSLDTARERPAEGISEPQPAFFGEKDAARPERSLQESFLPPEGFRVLAQLAETYILCEGKDGLLLIDQHAAHERVLYESLRKSFRNGRVETQGFLVPHRMEFSLKDGRLLERSLESLRQMGLEIEPFGGSSFVLRSVPSVLIHASLEEMFVEILPALDQGALNPEGVLDAMLTVMACHGAIRANQSLTPLEMSTLVEQLFRTDLPTNCPHGRPTMKKFGYDELARMFKRVL